MDIPSKLAPEDGGVPAQDGRASKHELPIGEARHSDFTDRELNESINMVEKQFGGFPKLEQKFREEMVNNGVYAIDSLPEMQYKVVEVKTEEEVGEKKLNSPMSGPSTTMRPRPPQQEKP